eukprot:303558-Hanusia_phi.AAC.1
MSWGGTLKNGQSLANEVGVVDREVEASRSSSNKWHQQHNQLMDRGRAGPGHRGRGGGRSQTRGRGGRGRREQWQGQLQLPTAESGG